MTLGARVIKTGFAISLSLFICRLLNLESAVLAAIASVIIMQPSLYGTWRHVWEQIQANTLGALIAFAAIQFIGNDLFSIGLVSVIVIALSLRMKMGSSIGLTLVTVLVIMEAPGDDIQYAINRFTVILIGILSALVVNVLIAPPNYRRMFEQKVREVFSDMSLLLRTAISDEMTEQAYKQKKQHFHDGLTKCAEMYAVFDEERRRLGKIKPINARQIVVYKHMLRTLHKGENILELISGHYVHSGIESPSGAMIHTQLDHLIKYHEYIFLKHEGDIKQTDHHAQKTSQDNHIFMRQLLASCTELHETQLRTVLIGSAVYEYGMQLAHLDRLVEHQIKKHRPGKSKRSRLRFAKTGR